MAQFQQQYGQSVSNQVSFTLSERQYMDAAMVHFKSRQMLKKLAILLVIAFAASAASSFPLALGTLLIFAFYAALLFFTIRQSMKKQYRSMPQLHGVQTVQFSEEGLVWHNDYALSRIKWPMYQKFAAGENMYLLYQAPNMFNMIPRGAFADAEQEAAFRALLELHVKPAGKTASPRRRREV